MISGPQQRSQKSRQCDLTLRTWCKDFLRQSAVPFTQPPPRGSKICSKQCNGGGVHIDERTKEDLDWLEPDWTHSRCGGHCDDSVAACYCGVDSKYHHIPNSNGSWAPHQQYDCKSAAIPLQIDCDLTATASP
eukprot:gene16953-23228_t